MKIIYLTTFFHPVTGGVESHVLGLAKKMSEKGHEVTVLCSDSNKKQGYINERNSIVAGIKIVRFKTWFNISHYHKFFPGVFSYLLKNEFDVIHMHGARKSEGYLALLVAKIKKKKIILSFHNPFATNTRSKGLDYLIKLHDKTIGPYLMKKFNKIIALLPSEKKQIQQLFQVPTKNIKVIPLAIDDIFFTKGNKEKFLKDWSINGEKWDQIVLGVGRISEAKGFQNLEYSVKKLKRTLFIFIGGDDGYLNKLENKFRHYNNVLFTKRFISPDKLINAYAAADIFVSPSHHEGFGLVMLEAMAQGLPVITTNQGGPKELVEDLDIPILDPHQQELWYATINQIIANTDTKERITKQGEQLVKEMRWKKILNSIEKIYKES